jgi:hypothetical protein
MDSARDPDWISAQGYWAKGHPTQHWIEKIKHHQRQISCTSRASPKYSLRKRRSAAPMQRRLAASLQIPFSGSFAWAWNYFPDY